MKKPKINMDAFNEHRWKDFLLGLSPGVYDLSFSTVNEIESIRSVGTRLNSYGIYDVTFKFSPNFPKLTSQITVLKKG